MRTMRSIEISRGARGRLKILCLGAHGDDIEIGCGGTILRLLSENTGVEVHWVVFSSGGPRAGEARTSAKKFLAGAGKRTIVLKSFEDGFFPYKGGALKEFFERLKTRVSPDLIFTHYRQDLHQDHRLVSELTWNTFRDHLILEYEVVKYDGDLGSPNVFVHLTGSLCRQKVDHLMKSFKSQQSRDWFSPEVFLAVLRIRGVESRAPEKYAEGFYAKKLVI